jgi:C1A family cysteine protease
MPASDEKSVGGHAVLAVGYDDATREFLVRNSWGTDWGLKGYFKIPYAYLTTAKLASDFWTIRGVDQGTKTAKTKAKRKKS